MIFFEILSFVAFTHGIVTYPNFQESLHLAPIKFPQDPTKPPTPPAPTTTITAKPAITGLHPVVFPNDVKPKANPDISPRTSFVYGLPVYLPVYVY